MPLTIRLHTVAGLQLENQSARSDSPEIAEAAAVIRSRGIVVFPTETVYGIGAGFEYLDAVTRVNELKQRPAGMPLMIHCAEVAELTEFVRMIPVFALPLLEKFLPGPLALVLAASDRVPAALRGPDNTIGIRVTSHHITQALIRRAGMPLVGTSANLHGRSATADFSAIAPTITAGADLVIDAGRCGPGIASTVVNLTVEPPRVLRAGVITRAQLEAATGMAWAGLD